MEFFKDYQIVAFNNNNNIGIFHGRDSDYARVFILVSAYGTPGMILIEKIDKIRPITKAEYNDLIKDYRSAPAADVLEEHGLEFFKYYPESESDEDNHFIGDAISLYTKDSYLK